MVKYQNLFSLLGKKFLLGFFTLLSLTIVQPVQADSLVINSNTQTLQQTAKNQTKMIFQGNVVANYGKTLVLKANKVDVITVKGVTTVFAYGSPVVIIDKSRELYLESQEVNMNFTTNLMEAKKAKVTFKGNKLESDTILYNLKTNNLEAKGGNNGRVTTTIINIGGK